MLSKTEMTSTDKRPIHNGRVDDLDLRRLRYFVAVATRLHFGKAAESLHIAQPALSQQIRLLEKQLGVRLLERSTRSVALTPAGQRLLDRGRSILAESQATIAEVRQIGAGEAGTVRLGFIGSATYGLMPLAARALHEELPKVRIELLGEQLASPLAKGLHDGTLDVAVLRECPELEGLYTRPLLTEPLVVVLPEGHRLADRAEVRLADLADEVFVSYPLEHSAVAKKQREACLAAGFEPNVQTTVAETSTLVTFVASALGVALVPQRVDQVRIPGVRYLPLRPELTVSLLLARRDRADDAVVQRVEAVLAGLG